MYSNKEDVTCRVKADCRACEIVAWETELSLMDIKVIYDAVNKLVGDSAL